jgi:hypothetical protein
MGGLIIMRTKALKDFIQKNGHLFWYTPEDKGEKVTDELLVETILNYGSLEQIKTLFDLIGMRTAANIFRNMTGRKKMNYFPEIHNYFDLYFKKYAP